MPMMGNLGPLFAGLMGRGANTPPPPMPMSPVMGSQIASMFGGGRPSPMPGAGPMGTIASRLGAGPSPVSKMAPQGPSGLPALAKAFGARRRFS